jgi:hypothetical protein
MHVSEEQRRELHDLLRRHLDERTATLMLEVTVPANVELATRSDIQELRAEMLLRFTELDGRLSGQITQLDGRLTRQITELDGRLSGQITELDGRLSGQITQLDGRLSGQITQLDGRLKGLGATLTSTLYFRVIPVIGVLLGVATFIGITVG